MKRLILILLSTAAAASWALPGDLVVLSSREVVPDAGGGLYYLGLCGPGYLYNGSNASLAAVAPYKILADDGFSRDYYLVWTRRAGVAAADFLPYGKAVPLGGAEFLVAVPAGADARGLRDGDGALELMRLEPVTPSAGTARGHASQASRLTAGRCRSTSFRFRFPSAAFEKICGLFCAMFNKRSILCTDCWSNTRPRVTNVPVWRPPRIVFQKSGAVLSSWYTSVWSPAAAWTVRKA